MKIALQILLLAAAVSCGSGDDTSKPITPLTADGQLGLVRTARWSGGGNELTVRVQTQQGAPLLEDVSADFQVVATDEQELNVSAKRIELPPGFTALVVVPPSDAAARNDLTEALQSFVNDRQVTESIGVFVVSDALSQVTGFTMDRARIAQGLAVLKTLQPSGSLMDGDVMIDAATRLTLDVNGPGENIMRAVVVVGSELAQEKIPAEPLPVLFAPSLQDLPKVSQTIDSFAQNSYYSLGVCAGAKGAAVKITAEGLQGALDVGLMPSLPEEAAAECEASEIPGQRSFPSKFRMVFSAAERPIFDERVASNAKDDFDLSLQVGDNNIAIKASGHLRGKGTLLCERKSYTINLKGDERAFFPSSVGDKFHLIAMCADNRYIEQYTANQLLAQVGLFPLHFRYVELWIEDEPKGVYLMVEMAKEELVRDNSAVVSVVRRRYAPPNDSAEVEFSRTDDAAAVNDYEELNTWLRGLSADALPNEISTRLDIDRYLTLLAMMSIFENGDWVDEVFMVATDSLVAAETSVGWYSPMGWDNDDLFSECHYASKYAFVDAAQLAYCAESRLDHVILGNPALFERFVSKLEDLLTQHLTETAFLAATEETGDQILPFFARAEIAGAMTELLAENPAAADPALAQEDIAMSLEALNAHFKARRTLLLSRIAAYRMTEMP